MSGGASTCMVVGMQKRENIVIATASSVFCLPVCDCDEKKIQRWVPGASYLTSACGRTR